MIYIEPERFEEMVETALDALPPDLGELMRNVAVTVEHGPGPRGLLGLYQGIPLTGRTTEYAGVLPDRITIYRLAICRICDTDDQVAEQVRRTVIHEVAHHFGIDDDRLAELGWLAGDPRDEGDAGAARPDPGPLRWEGARQPVIWTVPPPRRDRRGRGAWPRGP